MGACTGKRASQLEHLPDERAGAACLGDSLVGDADLLANCAPTALSKNPPPEEVGLGEVGLEEVGLEEVGLGDAALVGVSDFLANWAPTALSKKPPPEEAGLEVPAKQCLIGQQNTSHLENNLEDSRRISAHSVPINKMVVSVSACCREEDPSQTVDITMRMADTLPVVITLRRITVHTGCSYTTCSFEIAAIRLPDDEEGLEEDEGRVGAACLGASDFFANWAPTAPSKKPGEAGLLEEEDFDELDELGDQPGVHFSFLLANWDPIAPSKKPPPEEAGLGEDEGCLGAALEGASDFFAN